MEAGLTDTQEIISEDSLQRKGVFITFEGGEGAGKSTHSKALCRQLEMRGHEVISIREPGGTLIGEKIRKILLDCDHGEMAPVTELFLYEAARAQIVTQIIKPALAAGKVVLCDRFFDSTTAYQGYARGLDASFINSLNLTASDSLVPDRTIVLITNAAHGLERARHHSQPDRLESEEQDFHERVIDGFKAIAKNEPDRVRIIDSNRGITEVFCDILNNVSDLFPFDSLSCGAQDDSHSARDVSESTEKATSDVE